MTTSSADRSARGGGTVFLGISVTYFRSLRRPALPHFFPASGGIPAAVNSTSRRSMMNSFNLTAVGNLTKNPELTVKGDTTYTRFCLVGNDFAGRDEHGNSREISTGVWFVAFEGVGEVIAKNARKGDQLIVQAQIRANNWIDKEGEKKYDYTFVVQNFKFGAPGKAKREELAQRDEREMGALETEI
jgi:single-strand DNA-binding protein